MGGQNDLGALRGSPKWKFYLYYGDANSGGIGVAVSDLPTGPYIDNHDRPVVGMDTPGVLLYDENNRCIKNKKECRGPYRVVRTGGCGALIHVCL